MEFEWDTGNSDKNLKEHQVSDEETEEVFSDSRKVQKSDPLHSAKEKRFVLLGKTKKGRLLFIVYTIRKTKIRVISARDANQKERPLYEKAT